MSTTQRSRASNPEHRAKFATVELHPALHEATTRLAANMGISWSSLLRYLLAREARMHGILFSSIGFPSNELLRIEGEITKTRHVIQGLYVQIAQAEMHIAELVKQRLDVIGQGILADLPPPKAPRTKPGESPTTAGPVARALNGDLHALVAEVG